MVLVDSIALSLVSAKMLLFVSSHTMKQTEAEKKYGWYTWNELQYYTLPLSRLYYWPCLIRCPRLWLYNRKQQYPAFYKDGKDNLQQLWYIRTCFLALLSYYKHLKSIPCYMEPVKKEVQRISKRLGTCKYEKYLLSGLRCSLNMYCSKRLFR